MKKIAVLFFAFLIFYQLSSQEADKTKWTMRLDMMVPQPVSNKAFQLSFTGICDVGASLNVRLGKLFNVGAQYRYKQFQVRGNKIADVYTLQHTHNACAKFSLDISTSKNTIFSPGIGLGYNWINYTYLPCSLLTPTGQYVTAINMEPQAAFVWMIDEGFGMGLMVNYNLLAYEFDPVSICLSEHKSYSAKEMSGLTGSFSFGFSVFIDFAHRPEGFEE